VPAPSRPSPIAASPPPPPAGRSCHEPVRTRPRRRPAPPHRAAGRRCCWLPQRSLRSPSPCSSHVPALLRPTPPRLPPASVQAPPTPIAFDGTSACRSSPSRATPPAARTRGSACAGTGWAPAIRRSPPATESPPPSTPPWDDAPPRPSSSCRGRASGSPSRRTRSPAPCRSLQTSR
jgi:hypothetical protein